MGKCQNKCDEYYKEILANIHDCIIVIDESGMIEYSNLRIKYCFGIDNFDEYYSLRIESRDGSLLYDTKTIFRILLSETTIKEQEAYLYNEEIRYPILVRIVPRTGGDFRINGAILIISDNIAGIMDVEKRKALAKMAFVDRLDKVMSRHYFSMKLEDIHRKYFEGGKEFSVIAFETTNLKQINEMFGRKIGDELLQNIVTVINETIGAGAVIGRWEGSQLYIAVEEMTRAVMILVMDKLEKNIRRKSVEIIGNNLKMAVAGVAVEKKIRMDIYLKKLEDSIRLSAMTGKSVY